MHCVSAKIRHRTGFLLGGDVRGVYVEFWSVAGDCGYKYFGVQDAGFLFVVCIGLCGVVVFALYRTVGEIHLDSYFCIISSRLN